MSKKSGSGAYRRSKVFTAAQEQELREANEIIRRQALEIADLDEANEDKKRYYFINEAISALPILLLRTYQEAWAQGVNLDNNPFSIYGIPNALIDSSLILTIHWIMCKYSEEFNMDVTPDQRNLLTEMVYLLKPEDENFKTHLKELRDDFMDFRTDTKAWRIGKGFDDTDAGYVDNYVNNMRSGNRNSHFVLYVQAVNVMPQQTEYQSTFKERTMKTIKQFWANQLLADPDKAFIDIVNYKADSDSHIPRSIKKFQLGLNRPFQVTKSIQETVFMFFSQVAVNVILGNSNAVLGVVTLGSLAMLSKQLNLRPATPGTSNAVATMVLLSNFGVKLSGEYLPDGVGSLLIGVKKSVSSSGKGASFLGSLLSNEFSPPIAAGVVSFPYIYMFQVALIKQYRLLEMLNVPKQYLNLAASSLVFLFDFLALSLAHAGLVDTRENISGFEAERYLAEMTVISLGLTTITFIYHATRPQVNNSDINIVQVLTALGSIPAASVSRGQFFATGVNDANAAMVYKVMALCTVFEVSYKTTMLYGKKIKGYGEFFDKTANKQFKEINDYYGENVYEISEGNNVINFGMYKLEVVFDRYRNLNSVNGAIPEQSLVSKKTSGISGLARAVGKILPSSVSAGSTELKKTFTLKELLNYENGRYVKISYDLMGSAESVYSLLSETSLAKNKDIVALWIVAAFATQAVFKLYRTYSGDMSRIGDYTGNDRMLGMVRLNNVEYYEYNFNDDIRSMVDHYRATRNLDYIEAGASLGFLGVIQTKLKQNVADINDIYDLVDKLDLSPIERGWKDNIDGLDERDLQRVIVAVPLTILNLPPDYTRICALRDTDSYRDVRRVDLVKALMKVLYRDIYSPIIGTPAQRDSVIRYIVFLLFYDGNLKDFALRDNRKPKLPDIVEYNLRSVTTVKRTGEPELEMLQFQNLLASAALVAVATYKLAWGMDVNLIPFLKQPNDKLLEMLRVQVGEFVDDVVLGVIVKSFEKAVSSMSKLDPGQIAAMRSTTDADGLARVHNWVPVLHYEYRPGYVPITMQIVLVLLEYIIEQVRIYNN